MKLAHVPLLERLSTASHVLLVGAGGGFDFVCAIPLFVALRDMGKTVTLANLSFTYLGGTDAEMLAPALHRITARTQGEARYFPERYVCEWLEARGERAEIYAFDKVGVVPLREAYRTLLAHTGADALVLVDGGTDILMRGDEAGLGTPAEDMTSLCAASGLDVAQRYVVCLGFGIDAFHGVCHAHFLESVAALSKAGGFLGAWSVLAEMEEGRAYRQVVDWVHQRMPARGSIVNASIASALEGEFGDHHRLERTAGSTLFINPLMSMYWAFTLDSVAARSLYLSRLEGTRSIFDVELQIEGFRHEVRPRPRVVLPM